MSELDGISPINLEQYKRKYIDSHTEIKAISMLKNNIKDPSDLNASQVKKYKKKYEVDGFHKRAENLEGMVYDTIEVRAVDMLDRKQLPMKDLLKIGVSMKPKNINLNANVTNTFADLWTTIDIEGEVEEDD